MKQELIDLLKRCGGAIMFPQPVDVPHWSEYHLRGMRLSGTTIEVFDYWSPMGDRTDVWDIFVPIYQRELYNAVMSYGKLPVFDQNLF